MGQTCTKGEAKETKETCQTIWSFFCGGKGPCEIWTNKRHLGNLVGFEKRSGEKVLIELFIDLENEVLDVF